MADARTCKALFTVSKKKKSCYITFGHQDLHLEAEYRSVKLLIVARLTSHVLQPLSPSYVFMSVLSIKMSFIFAIMIIFLPSLDPGFILKL